jgi:hypothetical protein
VPAAIVPVMKVRLVVAMSFLRAAGAR